MIRMDNMSKVEELIKKGVEIDRPLSVEIGDDVDIDRISGDGVSIYAGSKIFGADTLILPGAKLGYESPVTVDNCQVGPDVELKGGYFNQSVFLEKAKLGMGSHVREASILEEQAVIAHTVALKHTILFPFVTLGSLINFCDCLMAGGTSRKNHSEVGSSYIHFNFTPSQDKATASLIGEVPRGVMLNQKPIFLGGQGGLVGPCRLNFGITVAAGTIVRKDETREDRLIFGGGGKGGSVPFVPENYQASKRIIMNNIIYIANLIALQQWYRQVRISFISKRFPGTLMLGLKKNIHSAIQERIHRLEAVCLKPPESSLQKSEIYNRWPELKDSFHAHQEKEGDTELRDKFLESVSRNISAIGKDYIAVIQGLAAEDSEIGVQWLQGIVDRIIETAKNIVPSLS
jgi:bifunctional UDP-N-acetylglucosamine pyrophosphorylase / glucosamine-1-phosphate N-acetyltransferase